jgi:membrane associated rhomboid family serine protease
MIPLKDNIPSQRIPFITVGLIIGNIIVYIHQLMLGQAQELFIWKYGAVAQAITTFQPVHPASTLFPLFTLITAQFVHGSIWHLGGNMLFLWIFGDNVEDKLGHLRYFLFYLVCGILSIVTQVVVAPNATVPLVGASGAIAGVMGAYIVRFPRARIMTLLIIFFFIRIVWIPALVFLGLWFIFQLLVAAPSVADTSGGVAYFAHIGGFVAGMVLFKLLEKY